MNVGCSHTEAAGLHMRWVGALHKGWPCLLDDVVLRLRDDGAVSGSPDVAQQLLLAVGGPAREQAAAVDGAQRGDALAPRVQLPKPCARRW